MVPVAKPYLCDISLLGSVSVFHGFSKCHNDEIPDKVEWF